MQRGTGITESFRSEKTSKIIPAQPSPPQNHIPTSTCHLNPCRDGDSTPSLGTLTALSVNNSFLISNLNLLCYHLMKEKWAHSITLFQLPTPEHPQRISRISLSMGAAPASTEGLQPAALPPSGPSPPPPLSQLEISLGRELGFGSTRSFLTRHCSVGNCFLSFPLSR